MCPACLASAALMVAGTSSVGGLTAFVVKKLRSKRAAQQPPLKPLPREKT